MRKVENKTKYRYNFISVKCIGCKEGRGNISMMTVVIARWYNYA